MDDDYLKSAIEYETKTAANGGWCTVILAQIPTLLFAGIVHLVFLIRVTALPQFPPDNIDKGIIYGLSMLTWVAIYSLLSGGYGLLSIPSAVVIMILVFATD
jgi:hypothetical protein